MNNQTKAPSVASIFRKLVGVTKKTVSCGVEVLDVSVDVLSDAVDLSMSTLRAAPKCVKETTNLYKYARAGYISTDKEISIEEATALIERESWSSVEDVFKSIGNTTGKVIHSTLNDEA